MPNSNPIRLVIVDDHEVVRIGLGAVLDLTPGMKVVGQAGRNSEAKKLVLRLKPDIVLLDIHLPDGSGVDTARDILADCPNTRVLFLTSFADDHTVLEASLTGAQGFILKDIASDALIRAIKTVASGQALLDPRVAKHTLQWLKNTNAQPRKAKRPFLSPQEQRLLPLVAQGLTNKEIAVYLQLSDKTVKNYIDKIYSKLNFGRRSQIASFYARSSKGSEQPCLPLPAPPSPSRPSPVMNGIGHLYACSLAEKEALPAFLIRHGSLKSRSATPIRESWFARHIDRPVQFNWRKNLSHSPRETSEDSLLFSSS